MTKLSTRISPHREHPGVPRSTLDDVFLTPRVLDKTAFDQFAQSLRTLIEQATSQGEGLKGAATAAEAVLKQFAQAGPLFESKINAGAKVVAVIEAKAKDLEAIAKRAEERLAAAQQAESRLESLMTQKLAEFEQRLRGKLNEASTQLERSGADLATKAARLQEGLSQTIAQSSDRLGALAATVEGQLTAKRHEIESHTNELETRLTRISDDMTKYAGPGLTALTALCERAERLLGAAGDSANPRAGSAADTLARLETSQSQSVERIGEARRQVEEACTQAAQARHSLTKDLDECGPRIDALLAKHDRLAQSLSHTTTSADSLDRRREQIKGTMLEALSLAESVQLAVHDQLVTAKQNLAREIDAMRETLAAAAMVHSATTTPPSNSSASQPSLAALMESAAQAGPAMHGMHEPKVGTSVPRVHFPQF